jgi:hypothetical protein
VCVCVCVCVHTRENLFEEIDLSCRFVCVFICIHIHALVSAKPVGGDRLVLQILKQLAELLHFVEIVPCVRRSQPHWFVV